MVTKGRITLYMTLVYVWQISNSEGIAKNLCYTTEGGWISYYMVFFELIIYLDVLKIN